MSVCGDLRESQKWSGMRHNPQATCVVVKMQKTAIQIASASICLLLIACNEGIIPPGGSGIVQIDITPAVPMLVPGDSQDFSAIALRASGAVATDAVLTWSSSAPAIVSVAPATGRVVVHEAGTAWIKVSVHDGPTDSVRVETCDSYGRFTGTRFVLAVTQGSFMNNVTSPHGAAIFDQRDVLWGGSLMFGTTADDFVDADGVWRLASDDVLPAQGICQTALPNGDYTRTLLRIVKQGAVPAVKVEQESFAPTIPPSAVAIVLVRYTFTNTSNAPIAGLRVGLMVDWDVHIDTLSGPGNNVGRLNATIAAAETFQPGLETAGVAGINVPITSYRPYTSLPRFTRGDLFNALAAGVVNPDPFGPGDIRQLVGFGPFDLAPAQARSIVLAFTAGYTRAEFVASVETARVIASAFPNRVIDASN
jgi:hypothetical protein